MFPKIVGFPPKSSIKKIGFSMIFTIHIGVFPPFKETPTWLTWPQRGLPWPHGPRRSRIRQASVLRSLCAEGFELVGGLVNRRRCSERFKSNILDTCYIHVTWYIYINTYLMFDTVLPGRFSQTFRTYSFIDFQQFSFVDNMLEPFSNVQ